MTQALPGAGASIPEGCGGQGSSLPCTADKAGNNQLLGKLLEEMLYPWGLEVCGALCRGF